MAELKTYRYFAGNAWHEPATGRWFDSENPATGEVWARVPDCGAEDVARAVAAAKAAFHDGSWGRMMPAERGRVLRRIGDVISAHAERLGAVELRDNGRLPNIAPGLKPGGWQVDSFHYYAGMCDKLEGRLIPAEVPDMHNYLTWEPFGVVALILPWNSPVGTLIWKLAPCLAAGNTVVIKPSEQASCSTLDLMAVLEEAGLPPGVVNVVTGFGPTTGEPLIDHPDVRMVSFTGGAAGGRAAATIAARQVKPTVMELGGKSPQIVLPDADLDLAVNGIAAGIFPAGGQSCISGSRLLVHRSVINAFTERLVKVVRKARTGPPDDPASQIGPIANRPHYEAILRRIAAAEAAGHRLLLDGRTACRDKGYYIGPTIFADVPNASELAQNEVFGPVVSTEAWDAETEVIRTANDTPYGLAAGIWSRDVAKAMRMAGRIEAGTVYINNYFNAATQSPVGGWKQSGHGRENGWEGMRAFLQTKSVWLATDPHQPDPFPA
ncbi:aldehyde dehydrogenase family protein [Defluviimonas sp. D31]|uniref:aldehyde dehydrogenase family protein n=1 Tax=Defluviimonas sp. D31 TaxID=3083253 RepID=UPI00296FD30C|nr:aldehyde dehydrogenase family protein [Defluviimonas sp. D31]MDW4551188.1 aldehyde dehydrogenase family protein [Defluviimonas sp. D31]